MLRYVFILAPFGASLLAAYWLPNVIQDGELGTAIGYLMLAVGGVIAALMWGIGIAMSLSRPRQVMAEPGVPGFLAWSGGAVLIAGLVGLAVRYAGTDFDTDRYLWVNWPFLSWLAVYSGALTALGGLSLLGRK